MKLNFTRPIPNKINLSVCEHGDVLISRHFNVFIYNKKTFTQ